MELFRSHCRGYTSRSSARRQMNGTIESHSPVSSRPVRYPLWSLLVFIATLLTLGAPAVLAQVAPPRAPTTAPSPAEELTIFSEGTYPQPDAKRTTIYYSR